MVEPALRRGLRPRLERFLEPFVASLETAARRRHAHHDVGGLVSELRRNNAAGIADLHDQDRQGWQKCVGQVPWEERPLLTERARQVGAELGQADGVVVFDPAAVPTKGTAAGGVPRPWCGRLGQRDNCQGAVSLGSASRAGHARVDLRLDRPKEGAQDGRRRAEAGVPKAVRFRTRHEVAVQMRDDHGAAAPQAGVAGDDARGRGGGFRRELRRRGAGDLLAVPANPSVRDLAAPAPP